MPDENPVLNNPYSEPRRHYSTGVSGELDYAEIVVGRRIFTGEVQSIQFARSSQKSSPLAIWRAH